ncbi:MAG: DUF1611 domain-containing protein [Candidatus Eremiobacteraeota bacterium]|nr:DUF1611 domain-containing protein [Candidatus Eremiobacteraeota bacterium]MBV8497749.1 DUF1611 domain-containing protein [Candidatus Eremiobacteraeota bacterium]
MRVGVEMLNIARSAGARTIFVVGTGRNVGKTTAVRAIYEAARADGLRVALAALGRDAESMWLHPGTIFATARALLPASPAAEILSLSPLLSAAGGMLYACAAVGGFFELGGPPTASGVREVVEELLSRSDVAIVDGAVDRVAAVAGSDGAIVVAAGADAGATKEEAVAEAAALVARLRVPAFDPEDSFIEVEGALTAADAAAFVARGETRQIVVRDPTQVALSGRSAQRALERLKIRCRRPLRVIAATVASIGSEREFEPVQFAGALASATGLPAFDVFRGARAA